MMTDDQNLTKRSVAAAGWVLIFQFFNQLVQIAFGIIMVRLLTPTDYGVLGILAIFWAICQEFIQGGFSQALLQRKEVTPIDLSSVFYYNIFLSLLCCGLMIWAAPWIADWYEVPILERVIRITAWTLPIGALGSIQNVILGRRLSQGLINVSKLLSLLVSVPVAIYMAVSGWGVLALVWQSFISTVFGTIFVFLFVRWIPMFRFSGRSLASLFQYGSRLLADGLLYAVFTNIYNVIFGKIYSVQTLGYFEQARKYSSLWPTSVQGPIATVLFPAFSKIQDDRPRLKNAFRRSLVISLFIIIFPCLLLGTLAQPVVELILTPKWLPSVPMWQLLTFCYLMYPLQVLGMQVTKAIGDSTTYLWLQITRYVLTILNILCFFQSDIHWMLVGMVAMNLIVLIIEMAIVSRRIDYSLHRQLADSLPYLTISFVACVSSWLTHRSLSVWNPWFGLIAAVGVGLTCYGMINILFQTTAVRELRGIFGNWLGFSKR